MLRGVLIVVLLCLSMWATAAQVIPESSDAIMTAVAADACAQPNDPQSTGDSHGQWDAQHQSHASITESVWKFPLVHAELAGIRCFNVIVAMRDADPPDHRARPSPDHLLHIPLLI